MYTFPEPGSQLRDEHFPVRVRGLEISWFQYRATSRAVLEGGGLGDSHLAAHGDVGPRRHGDPRGGVVGATDQGPSLTVLVIVSVVHPVVPFAGHVQRVAQLIVVLLLPGKDGVLHVQRGVHLLACRACARLQEALFEVVAEESV